MGFWRWSRCRSRSSTSDIADDGVCRSRMAIIPLGFNERVIYQQGRTLQVLSLAGIAGEGPSVNSSEQITRLRISDRGFWYDKRNRTVGVETASRQVSYLRFRWNADNETDNLGGNSPILKGGSAIRVCPHTNIKLLGRRIVRLRRVRVPDDPPSAARRHAAKISYFHFEYKVACRRRLTGCNVVNSKGGWSGSLCRLFWMAKRSSLEDQPLQVSPT